MLKRTKSTLFIALILVAAMLVSSCAHPWRIAMNNNTPVPEASSSPEATEDPNASEEPVDTGAPTENPSETDIPTDEPATDEPVVTDEPVNNDTATPTESGTTDTQAPATAAATANVTTAPTTTPKLTSKPTQAPTPTPTPKPTQAPVTSDFADFSAPSINNAGSFSNSDFSKYKLTLVNFWSTTCAPCIQEMPHLQQISNEYASKGLRVVTVLFDSEISGAIPTALGIIQGIGMTIPVIRCNASIKSAIVDPYNVAAMPNTFLVDSNGHIVQRITSSKSYAEWKAIVDRLL
ncbi:MAG: redoxin domain-containing protein [Christensenellaceae bacterium]|nr:redoxin domain-containing protein [Christensenellaceae bacterium]